MMLSRLFANTIRCRRRHSLALMDHAVHRFSNDSPSPPDEGAKTTKTTKRRRFRRIEEVPSYRDFVHRQTVLTLYRQFLRTVRPLSDRKELTSQIKKEFSAMKNEGDAWNRKRALNEGQRRLKDLQATVSISATFGASSQQYDDSSSDSDQKVGKGWPWERND
ncbi:expressed unknown protein [Seminavis robusta]|uniref:Complex 1 LYR protein domain-containing protein n=1 Tax=Seminavis robusta TaxID=568900 RepID=A0A9N8DWH2_9STRA|nr:expressed unknown protein [Seminavis robusta]|eukprot:Sro404_g135980.1 n/a (163) ;mRNA; r:54279-54767